MLPESLIGLLSAVSFESRLLLSRLKNRKNISPFVTSGTISTRHVVHIQSGIGISNSAHAATVLIERFSPEIIILFGIAGAYPNSGLSVGDLALAEREIYADTGISTRSGFLDMKKLKFPLYKKGKKSYFNEFPLHKGMVSKALDIIGKDTHKGIFLTLSQATGTKIRATELEKNFQAICENMEGAAAAHICLRYGIPMLELRGISNIVEDRNPKKWNKSLASKKSQIAVLALIQNLQDLF